MLAESPSPPNPQRKYALFLQAWGDRLRRILTTLCVADAAFQSAFVKLTCASYWLVKLAHFCTGPDKVNANIRQLTPRP